MKINKILFKTIIIVVCTAAFAAVLMNIDLYDLQSKDLSHMKYLLNVYMVLILAFNIIFTVRKFLRNKRHKIPMSLNTTMVFMVLFVFLFGYKMVLEDFTSLQYALMALFGMVLLFNSLLDNQKDFNVTDHVFYFRGHTILLENIYHVDYKEEHIEMRCGERFLGLVLTFKQTIPMTKEEQEHLKDVLTC